MSSSKGHGKLFMATQEASGNMPYYCISSYFYFSIVMNYHVLFINIYHNISISYRRIMYRLLALQITINHKRRD